MSAAIINSDTALGKTASQSSGTSMWIARASIAAILLLRATFFSLFIFSFNQMVDLGTSPWLLSIGAIVGVLLSSALAFTRLRVFSLAAMVGGLYLLFRMGLLVLAVIPGVFKSGVFGPYVAQLHGDLLFLVFAISLFSTWAFWRTRFAITLEVLLIAGSVIYLLSGHRDFHFDTPKLIGTLAWAVHLENLSMLIVFGGGLLVTLMLYFFVATLPFLSSLRASTAGSTAERITLQRARPAVLWGSILLLVCSVILFFVSQRVYNYYQVESITRTANGVGKEQGQGISPLGFHSALGSNNQPAALVRLEGDYAENPFSPMLYLRESALSEFKEQELVGAGPDYDRDVNASNPNDAYTGREDPALLHRTPVTQSIYLLADHKVAFALDYPLSIVRLKNPNPGRFKLAYKAYSMGPAFKLSELKNEKVGDSRWDVTARSHYLVTHPDERYHALAEQVTQGLKTPIEKAFAITDYLSANTIYTLSPNHETKPGEDQVAPYLFGDHRGYCVHFAHAMVYMFRSLGIPARIGTGYLTDLSQAKDGHILLRMSDRHAWAEIFIDGRGWIPFDIQPAQVESHAETQVDMSLLQELMDQLTPGEEILPDKVLKDEPQIEPQTTWRPKARDVELIIAGLLLLLLLAKLYLRFGYLLPGSPRFKLKRSYVSFASLLHDLGFPRSEGETRLEYARRMSAQFGGELHELTNLLVGVTYAPESADITVTIIAASRCSDLIPVRRIKWWRRALAFINPASVGSSFMGARW